MTAAAPTPTAPPPALGPRGPVDVDRAAAIRAAVAGVPFWWHSIDLGHGVITPGKDKSAERLQRMHMPADLRGQHVIDIGAWDGFFSFEAERRGAARVVAADRWDKSTGGEASTGFEVARAALGSRVEQVRRGVFALSPEEHGTFDLVLFLGVLYHLTDPMAAIRKLRTLCRGTLILDTEMDLLWCPRPAMAVYPARELRQDPTNWCGPNWPALRGMLLAAGFHNPRVVWRHPLRERLARAWRDRRSGSSLWAGMQRDRFIVHADAG